MLVVNEPIRTDAEKRAGHHLRLLRKARDWSQRHVAEEMKPFGYDWTQSTVARVEMGARPLRLNEALDLAALFGVSLTDLLAPPRGPDALDGVRGEMHTLRVALEDAEQQARETQMQAAGAAMDSAVSTAAVESIRSRLRLLEKWEEEALGDGQA